MLRFAVFASALAAGLFAAPGAEAQLYPPAPVPYGASYRGAPPPPPPADLYDDDDLPTASVARRPRLSRPEPFYGQPAEVDDWADDRAGAPYGRASRPYSERPATLGRRDGGGFDPRPPADLGMTDEEATGTAPPRAAGVQSREVAPQFRRQLVRYPTREPAGTIVVDTAKTYLYYVLGNGEAVRYGIGVGRDGFTWSGRERVSRMAEWPDWHPPTEMIGRQPYLPRFMAGGPGNPMGARALYLGKTIYRIHGTNEPHTIGKTVSSGCIRMLNEDVEDLYRRVTVGTQVVVLPGRPAVTASAAR